MQSFKRLFVLIIAVALAAGVGLFHLRKPYTNEFIVFWLANT